MYRVVIVEDDPMVSLLNRTFVERDARFQVVPVSYTHLTLPTNSLV